MMYKTALNHDISHGFLLAMIQQGRFLSVQRYMEGVWSHD
jgi:hypothetical protein